MSSEPSTSPAPSDSPPALSPEQQEQQMQQMAAYMAINMLARGFFLVYSPAALRALVYALLRAVCAMRTQSGDPASDGLHQFIRVVVTEAFRRMPPDPAATSLDVQEGVYVICHALIDPGTIFACTEMLIVYLTGHDEVSVPVAETIRTKQANLPAALRDEMVAFLNTLRAVRDAMGQ